MDCVGWLGPVERNLAVLQVCLHSSDLSPESWALSPESDQ